MKKYVTGLVVGKFCPMHKGHEYLIQTALEQCEKVIVLSYTSEQFTNCSASNREQWLKSILNDPSRLEVHVLDDLLPNSVRDDAVDEVHRKFCADYLLFSLDTTVQAVFSSEDYGPGFADFLSEYFTSEFPSPVSVDHVMVDQSRTTIPISGTRLRAALEQGDYDYAKQFISPIVIASFVRKILFLGGESTGKTTLVEALSKHFNTQPALEFGRFLYDKRNHKLHYEDMVRIAKGQIEVEQYRSRTMNPSGFLFCDTSPLTTLFYSLEWFGRCSSELTDTVWDSDFAYTKVYICAPDFPMVQDGTRQDETFRNKGHEFYLDRVQDDFTILTGTLEERIQQVLKDLENV